MANHPGGGGLQTYDMAEDACAIDDIAEPGKRVEDPDTRQYLRGRVAHMLERNNHGFPGAQPVSFSRRHLDELRRQDYYVCEKSDGIRYLLYMTVRDGQELHYLIDRKNDYWELYKGNLHIPSSADPMSFHRDTLIDGELVMDTESNGRKQPRFLAFDCLIYDGQAVLSKTLDKRLGYLKNHVIHPYKTLFEKFPQEREHQAFLVDMKGMQFSYNFPVVFRDIPKLRHGNDGLIFTCRATPYQFGTDPHILKWKPVNENTIDFRMRLEFPLYERPADDPEVLRGECPRRYPDYEAVPTARLFVFTGSGQYQQFQPGAPFSGDLHITEAEWETLKGLGDPLDNRIVECGLDEKGRWRLHRFRDDKQEANHISTVKSVMESIKDSVSQQELLDASNSIRNEWKTRNSAK